MDWSKDWPVIAGAAVVLVGLVGLSKGSAGQTVVSAGEPSGKSDAVAIAEIQANGSGYASVVSYMLADRRYASAEAISKIQADEQIHIANATANQENQSGFV